MAQNDLPGYTPPEGVTPEQLVAAGYHRIEPIDLEQLVQQGHKQVSAVRGQPPEILLADPAALIIRESYQREISTRGLKLINRGILDWDWSQYQLPHCVRTPLGLECYDGQHTAIMAASHPDITLIPVAVSPELEGEQALADAFIGVNTNRNSISPTDAFFARVTAGDESATLLLRLCAEAGIRICKYSAGHKYHESDTVAVAALGRLLHNCGPNQAARAFHILASSHLKPIGLQEIKAVNRLFTASIYGGAHSRSDDHVIEAMCSSDVRIKARRGTVISGDPYFIELAKAIYHFKPKG